MFGFPIGNGNAGFNDFVEKFTNNADSGFPNIQQREVFYSVKDGLWADNTIWQTASGRVGLTPTIIDDVYVRHNVSLDQTANSYNLYVPSYASIRHNGATSTNRILNVFGDFLCDGTINVNIGLANTITINLYGTKNRLATYIATTNSFMINYVRSGEQDLMPIVYDKLGVYNGTKYARSNVVVNYGLYGGVGAVFELGQYDLDCGILGDGAVTFDATLSKQAQGSILFRGTVAPRTNARLLFQGNPIVEFRNGIGIDALSFGQVVSGNGPWYFTTNNQSIRGTNISIDAPVIIASGITLSIGNLYSTTVTLSNTINGADATSNLIMQLNGILNFTTQIGAEGSMATGLFNFTTFTNTIGYTGNYSATIPSYFTTFHNLTISGTGTKTLGVNTTLNGNLSVNGGTFELSTYNLSVTGTTSCTTGTLSKNGAGNVLFVGNVSTALLDFSGGNPNVEVRGGIIFQNNSFTFNTGTGTWTFSTNNQSLVRATSVGGTVNFNGDVLISGAITLTTDTQTLGPLTMVINKSINGDNALSKLLNKQTIYMNNSLYPVPMVTGILDITTFSNVFGYNFNGNYTIPYTSFSGLYISGTGTKTISGTSTLSTTLNITSIGTLQLSTFDLSVTGTSTISGTLLKSGSGNILFIGNVQVGVAIDFSGGNPTIEFRGGISNQNNAPASNFGTGLITFSTNNQSLNNGVTPVTGFTFNNNILISGAITLQTSRTLTSYSGVFNGSINGDNVNSKFLMGTDTPTITYRNATQPMATGVLDTSTNINTWIYGLNNQNILGGLTILTKQVYRNLTLNGTGVKTLQGYVSVLNTYTLTSPASVNLNGYTITNP